MCRNPHCFSLYGRRSRGRKRPVARLPQATRCVVMPGFPGQFPCSPKSSPVTVPVTDSELLYPVTEIVRIIVGSVPGPGEAAGSKAGSVLALLGDGAAPRASRRREHAHRVPGGWEGAGFQGASMQGPAGAKPLSEAEGLEGQPCGQHGTRSGPMAGGWVLPRLVSQGGVFVGRRMGKPVKGRLAGRIPWWP